jgi:hypothetical protein
LCASSIFASATKSTNQVCIEIEQCVYQTTGSVLQSRGHHGASRLHSSKEYLLAGRWLGRGGFRYGFGGRRRRGRDGRFAFWHPVGGDLSSLRKARLRDGRNTHTRHNAGSSAWEELELGKSSKNRLENESTGPGLPRCGAWCQTSARADSWSQIGHETGRKIYKRDSSNLSRIREMITTI